MNRQTRIRIMQLTWPIFAAIGSTFTVIYKVLFAWWLDPWLQRRANQALWEDVQSNFDFLCERGRLVKGDSTLILPFNYACVRVEYGNVIFVFSRGRGEVNVSLASRSTPQETHRLAVVMAAFDSADVAECRSPESLSGLADYLRPRMDALNDLFSDSRHPEFKKRLSDEKKALRTATKTTEWELNQRLRQQHR